MNTTITLTVGAKLQIKGVPEELKSDLFKLFSYQGTKTDMYGCLEQFTKTLHSHHKPTGNITVPRGAMTLVVPWAKQNGLEVEIVKQFNEPRKLNLSFKGETRDYQASLIKQLGDSHNGLIKAATGAGKTATAIQIIANRNVPTLIIVPTTDLIQQWKDSLSFFLGLDPKKIGQLGNGKKDIKDITVGTYHTVVKLLADKRMKDFGMIIADEAQFTTPDKNYYKCVTTLKNKYLLGLSATPVIDDSTVPAHVIYGKHYATLSRQELTKRGYLVDFDVVTRDVTTSFPGKDYSKNLGQLVKDEARNNLIIKMIQHSEKKRHVSKDHWSTDSVYDGVTLVLCERVEHIETLSKKLTDLGIKHSTVMGIVDNKERNRIYEELRAGSGNHVLIGNIRIIGAGLDIARLSSLVLATPIASDGILAQAIGRVIRKDAGKGIATIYDIQDDGIFSGGSDNRKLFYEAEGKINNN